jgi:membrane protein implicated in regulation of membrane protease activity
MTPTLPAALLLAVALVITAVGGVDAARAQRWDTVTVFCLLALVLLALLSRVRGRRPSVPVRGDLVRWLRERSAVTGEPVEMLADRALATYREQYGDAPCGGRPGAPGRRR